LLSTFDFGFSILDFGLAPTYLYVCTVKRRTVQDGARRCPAFGVRSHQA
jgi:hypothetical protein